VDHNNKFNIHRIITGGHNNALEVEKWGPGSMLWLQRGQIRLW
jgi:hypothetical protein